jgi:hypothetical protein
MNRKMDAEEFGKRLTHISRSFAEAEAAMKAQQTYPGARKNYLHRTANDLVAAQPEHYDRVRAELAWDSRQFVNQIN